MQTDNDLVSRFDNMIIGQDETIFTDDEPGAQGVAFKRTTRSLFFVVTLDQIIKRWISQTGLIGPTAIGIITPILLCADVHHSHMVLLDQGAEIRQTFTRHCHG